SEFRSQIPWDHAHMFWGDERYVPTDNPESNYRMAKEALLDQVPCPAANIHPMPTHFASADDAARDYERILKDYFATDWPHFDLNLLGLGEEGHTASLFPGAPALGERTRWVVAVQAPAEPPTRLTLTLPALTAAAHIYVLVAGSKKADALHHVLTETPDPTTYPAAGLRAADGTLIWWVDRDAAALQTGATLMAIATAEDRIGANVDDSEVANASETGQTTEAPRDELHQLRLLLEMTSFGVWQ